MAIHYRKEGAPYCVYGHFKDDGGVFYIGLSSNRNRPYDYEARTDYHKRVAAKYGCTTRILAENLTKKEAVDLEAELIRAIGRAYLNEGPLVNFKAHHSDSYQRSKGRPKVRSQRRTERRKYTKKSKAVSTLKNKFKRR